MQLRRIVLLLAIASAAHANDARTEFQRAYREAAFERNDSEALRGYALFPYLRQQRLRLALVEPADQQADWTRIDHAAEDFFRDYGVEPVTRELRRLWYASLANREQWERYLANWREVDDKTLRCHALTARIKLQRFDALAPAVVQLWLSGESLPACEIPFEWLKTQSIWTHELIERRARLALNIGNVAFARQMIALLSNATSREQSDQATLLANWAQLIETPRRGIESAIADPQKEVEPNALLDGWTRFVRDAPEAAAQRYAALVRARKLGSRASRYALELALALSWNRRAEALTYFAKVAPQDFDERGYEWHARAALWNGQWKLASKVIASMPETLRTQTRWQYWLARAAAASGNAKSARERYATLLDDDNYYAALAAARLRKPYTPQQIDIAANETALQSIAQEPAFIRAHELRLTEIPELRSAANDEWRFGLGKLSGELRPQAVILASRWQWHDQAILTAAEQRLFNDYRLLYPRVFDAEVDAAAARTGLATQLIYATLRQESIFQIDAVSSAGAQGLMQLLPETARRTARRFNLAPPNNLFDPATNISIGAAYLKGYVDRFNGRTAQALASYNAGPNAVARWLPAKPKDIDVWIENIPFNETRTYVQRVLWHSVVFGWLASNRGQDTVHWLTTTRAQN